MSDARVTGGAQHAVGAGIASEQFRAVLGHFATGVTVLTAHGDRGPVGMTANSFTSVSLDPPLIAVCPAASSATWRLIRKTGRFCVNVLAAEHQSYCRQFASKQTDRFAGIAWHPREGGPAIDEAVAWIDCVIEQEHRGGDHMIVVGRVIALEATPDLGPLVFFRGGFSRLA